MFLRRSRRDGVVLPASGNRFERPVYLATHDGFRQGSTGIQTGAFPPESARHSQQRMLLAPVSAGRVGKPVPRGGNGIHGGSVVDPAGIRKMPHRRAQSPFELPAGSNQFLDNSFVAFVRHHDVIPLAMYTIYPYWCGVVIRAETPVGQIRFMESPKGQVLAS